MLRRQSRMTLRPSRAAPAISAPRASVQRFERPSRPCPRFASTASHRFQAKQGRSRKLRSSVVSAGVGASQPCMSPLCAVSVCKCNLGQAGPHPQGAQLGCQCTAFSVPAVHFTHGQSYTHASLRTGRAAPASSALQPSLRGPEHPSHVSPRQTRTAPPLQPARLPSDLGPPACSPCVCRLRQPPGDNMHVSF